MMRRFPVLIYTIVMILQYASFSWAQTPSVSMKPFAEFPLGTGYSEFVYSQDIYDGYSPSDLSIFHGDQLWISQLSDGKLVDLKSRAINSQVVFPKDHLGSLLNLSVNNLFTEKRLYILTDHIISFSIKTEPLRFISVRSYDQPKLRSSTFLIRDYVFFYSSEGTVYAIDPEGTLLQPSSARQLLLDWHEKTWYASEDMKRAHQELIKSGKFLIADGCFYPWISGTHVLEYFQRSGIRPDRDLENKLRGGDFTTWPDGVSLTGEMYISFSDGVNVISQQGKIVAIVDVRSINPMISDPKYNSGNARYRVSPFYITIHPNGDLYTLYAIKDEKAHIHKAEKSWGNDLVAVARAGVSAQMEAKTAALLKSLSSVELRILRNALFALHGYMFKSYDLNCYFRGFDWYTPDKSVKSDPALLTPEQKRLLDLITGIEGERTVK